MKRLLVIGVVGLLAYSVNAANFLLVDVMKSQAGLATTSYVTSQGYKTGSQVTNIVTGYNYVNASGATNAASGYVSAQGYKTGTQVTNIVTGYNYVNAVGATNAAAGYATTASLASQTYVTSQGYTTDEGATNAATAKLATFAGSANIATVGTITSGTWQGSYVDSKATYAYTNVALWNPTYYGTTQAVQVAISTNKVILTNPTGN